MAEFIFKDMVERAGLGDRFVIASAATSSEEIGNPVYPPARRKLNEHGISCEWKTARRLRAAASRAKEGGGRGCGEGGVAEFHAAKSTTPRRGPATVAATDIF